MTVISLLLASALSIHGLRRKSLSPSGAATAFVVGAVMMASSLKMFGWALIVFYLVGSRATKYGKKRKALLEDSYHEGGYRSGWQVVSNAFTAFLCCLAWNVIFVPQGLHAELLSYASPSARTRLIKALDLHNDFQPYHDGTLWCPGNKGVGQGWSRRLVFGALGHFACCLGDTLASELGILSKSKPVLITTLKPVPPGTNGGISVGGTLASIIGGSVIGFIIGVSLAIESTACRGAGVLLILQLGFLGALAGGGGSLLDSLLGATIQQTRYSVEKKRVVGDGGNIVTGLNILSNNQVNLVSSIVTSVLLAIMT